MLHRGIVRRIVGVQEHIAIRGVLRRAEIPICRIVGCGPRHNAPVRHLDVELVRFLVPERVKRLLLQIREPLRICSVGQVKRLRDLIVDVAEKLALRIAHALGVRNIRVQNLLDLGRKGLRR